MRCRDLVSHVALLLTLAACRDPLADWQIYSNQQVPAGFRSSCIAVRGTVAVSVDESMESGPPRLRISFPYHRPPDSTLYVHIGSERFRIKTLHSIDIDGRLERLLASEPTVRVAQRGSPAGRFREDTLSIDGFPEAIARCRSIVGPGWSR